MFSLLPASTGFSGAISGILSGAPLVPVVSPFSVLFSGLSADFFTVVPAAAGTLALTAPGF